MLLFILGIFLVPLLVIKLFFILVKTKCKSNVCLIGKTALVTGGNAGIGYQIVLALLSRGCRVIIADKEQDPNLKENIFRETLSANVVFQYVDLASFKSVREFANRIVKSEDKLDILVHNAGIATTDFSNTEDGLNSTMQVNYFSPFLLTHLLVDLLKKSPSRIIFTSSCLAYFVNFHLGYLKSGGVKEELASYKYNHSKIGVIIIANLFAQKLKQYKITSNSYHPGVVNTAIFKNILKQSKQINISKFYVTCLQILAILLGSTPQQGAQTAIHLSCANEVKDVTGQFFYENKPTFMPRKVNDKKFCNEIWEATEELVKLKPNEKI